MIKEFKCFTLLCDNCRADVSDYNEKNYTDFLSELDAYEEAKQCDWIEHEGKWYCEKCYIFICSHDDSNERIEIDKTRTTEVKND